MSRVAFFYQRERFLYGVAISISIILSLWMGYRETVINPDSICYLLSAEMVGKSGLSAAMHLCGQAKWPFYSVLIYSIVKLTHLSFPLSAYFIDGVFSLISVMMFILIVKELGGSRLTLWLAAAVILFSHEFNSVREYIVRDHGFWAFYLGSILFLLRFFQKPSMILALAFNVSLLIATLFRIEGAMFLLLMPFLSWFYTNYSWQQRLKHFLVLNSLTLVIIVSLAGWLMLHPQQTLDTFGRVVELKNQLLYGFDLIQSRYQATTTALAKSVLPRDSIRDAGVIWILVTIVLYTLNIIANLSLIYGLLVIYALKKHFFTRKNNIVLFGYLALNFFITFIFFEENYFLSKRYLIGFSLIFMLWVPFALNDLIRKWSLLRHRLLLLVSVFFITLSALSSIVDFGYSKAYIRQAGDWLSLNVSDQASLYVNDYQLMYYSHHFGDRIFEMFPHYADMTTIAHGQWKQYDYLALRLSKKEAVQSTALLQELNLSPVKDFSNRRGDHVVIYRIHP